METRVTTSTTSSQQHTDSSLEDLRVNFHTANVPQSTIDQDALRSTVHMSTSQPSPPSIQLIPIHVDILNQWRHLGATKGLASDTQIASYLLQHYDSTVHSPHSTQCLNCRASIPLYCNKCGPPPDSLSAPASFASPQNSSSHSTSVMTTAPSGEICFPTPVAQGAYQFPSLMDIQSPNFQLPGTEDMDRKDLLGLDGGREGDKKGKSLKKKKKKVKKFKSKKGEYTCKECGSHITPTARQRRRARYKPYKCADCGASFSYRRLLEDHLFEEQDGTDCQKCMHCGMVALNYIDIKNHTLQHTEDMPFKCQHCPLAFSLACNLKTHMRTHTGERPFSCTICDRAFTQSIALKVHMRKHTGEKPFKCEECSMAFAASSNLSRHMLKHTGEKPYKCQYCKAAFSQPGSLKTHTRKHTGERPYKCDMCGASFSDHSTMWKHKRKNTCTFSVQQKSVQRKSKQQKGKKRVRSKKAGAQPPPPPVQQQEQQQPPPQPQQGLQSHPTPLSMLVGPMGMGEAEQQQQMYRPQAMEEAPYMGWCFPMRQLQQRHQQH